MSTFWDNLSGIFSNVNFYFAVIRVTAPILFATLGCAVAEKAGSTNLGMEGIMLVAAFTGVIFSAFFGGVWVGLLAAIIAAVLMGLAIAYFSLKLKVDIILVGIAINLIGTGLTGFVDIRAHRRPLYHNLAAKRRIAPDQHPRHTGYTNSRKRAFGSQCAYICFLHGRCGHILPAVQNKSGSAHTRCG